MYFNIGAVMSDAPSSVRFNISDSQRTYFSYTIDKYCKVRKTNLVLLFKKKKKKSVNFEAVIYVLKADKCDAHF